MSKLAEIKAAAAAIAETAVDMTVATTGGGGGRLLPQGYAFGRLVEYVELGKQAQEFQGQAKAPKDEVQLGFALWGEGYTNDDGTPYILRLYPFAVDCNEKARAFLLFKALNWKGTAKHFFELVGEGYLVKIVHEPKSKADKTIVSRIDLKGFLPPLDPVTKAPYGIPEAPDDAYRYFLWDQPTKATWDSLQISTEAGKNFLQERIAGAVNFAGSALEGMLIQNGLTKPVAPAQAAPATPAAPVASPVLPSAPAAPVVAPVTPPLAQPVQMPVISAPVVAPVIPAPVGVGAPALPVIGTTTFPSNPALPQ